jgi:hypothetical protein
MDQPTHDEIRKEALEYLKEYDAEGSPYHDRSADAMADFLLESKFAEVDDYCDWPEDFCHEYFEAAKAILIDAGVAP